MLIKKEEAKRHQNSPNCSVTEHNHFTGKMSYATAEINGRYPNDLKSSLNLDCDTIFIVISGSGTIHSERGNFYIKPLDTCHIPKGEKYSIEGKNLVLGVINSPRWTAGQYRVTD
ncbi:MAG: hypothetical protein WC548_01165 [Candidatus Pacearchaeota archaeon]